MTVFDRVREDEARGDLGSARRRLASHVVARTLDPQVCERIARICLRMQDPMEAGRWFFLCGSADPEAEEAIRRFTRSCRGDPGCVVSRLPGRSRWQVPAGLPVAAIERLRQLGLEDRDLPTPVRASVTDASFLKTADLVIPVFVVVVIALIAFAAIGIVTVARRILR